MGIKQLDSIQRVKEIEKAYRYEWQKNAPRYDFVDANLPIEVAAAPELHKPFGIRIEPECLNYMKFCSRVFETEEKSHFSVFNVFDLTVQAREFHFQRAPMF